MTVNTGVRLSTANNYDWEYHVLVGYFVILCSSGAVTSVTSPLQFTLQTMASADPPVFTLTCVSTGGPATIVTWTRDGNNVPYDATHVLTQTVTDQFNIVYSNVLTVTGSESGIYTCSVTNDRTAPPLQSAPLTVAGEWEYRRIRSRRPCDAS